MAWYLTKLVITALLIVIISEISKRSTLAGAVLASIPLVSVLAMIWLYIDTADTERISALANSILWLILPSLVLFISLPVLLKYGVQFYLSLGIAIALTAMSYGAMILVLNQLGIKF